LSQAIIFGILMVLVFERNSSPFFSARNIFKAMSLELTLSTYFSEEVLIQYTEEISPPEMGLTSRMDRSK